MQHVWSSHSAPWLERTQLQSMLKVSPDICNQISAVDRTLSTDSPAQRCSGFLSTDQGSVYVGARPTAGGRLNNQTLGSLRIYLQRGAEQHCRIELVGLRRQCERCRCASAVATSVWPLILASSWVAPAVVARSRQSICNSRQQRQSRSLGRLPLPAPKFRLGPHFPSCRFPFPTLNRHRLSRSTYAFHSMEHCQSPFRLVHHPGILVRL